ncbi:MAG TPA: DUF6328 family protein [Thermoleophilaceae bacterium]|nr:DUF6328 family protein [Actinomycetota bacterium]HZC13827.1 DUF6328 family protein [Thermoleophilaceae bacterium]
MAESQEDKSERLNRELIELLNELRVALPGVQVLFAFLLTVPFQQGFQRMTDLQRDVYFSAVLLSAASTLCLIAPSAMHRILWRQRDKENLLVTANYLSIAGIAFLALGMVAVLLLITDVMFGSTAIALVTAIAGGLFAWLWFGFPLVRRLTSNT